MQYVFLRSGCKFVSPLTILLQLSSLLEKIQQKILDLTFSHPRRGHCLLFLFAVKTLP